MNKRPANFQRKAARWIKREQKFQAARAAERAAGHISNRSKIVARASLARADRQLGKELAQ